MCSYFDFWVLPYKKIKIQEFSQQYTSSLHKFNCTVTVDIEFFLSITLSLSVCVCVWFKIMFAIFWFLVLSLLFLKWIQLSPTIPPLFSTQVYSSLCSWHRIPPNWWQLMDFFKLVKDCCLRTTYFCRGTIVQLICQKS